VFVACEGSYQDARTGAVVAIDTTTLRARNVVTEQALGANVDSVVVLDADRLLLRLSPAISGTQQAGWAALVEWSMSQRTQREWVRENGWALTEPVLATDGRAYVGDRGDATAGRRAGVRVFDATSGHEITTSPIAVGALPYDLAASPQ
jgi:hypothetical protein